MLLLGSYEADTFHCGVGVKVVLDMEQKMNPHPTFQTPTNPPAENFETNRIILFPPHSSKMTFPVVQPEPETCISLCLGLRIQSTHLSTSRF